MNTVPVSQALVALLALQISKMITKFEMELDDKEVSSDQATKVLKRLFGRKITLGDLRDPERNTGANLRQELTSFDFDVDLKSASLLTQFLMEWHPGSPQCDQDHGVCGLYGVDMEGKQMRWLQQGNLCIYCQHGTVQVGEGQQTHHWDWITGSLVTISASIHRLTGFDAPLEEPVLAVWFDPKLYAVLTQEKVSGGRFLTYLMHADHQLSVAKDPYSVKKAVGVGGFLSTLEERSFYAHVMKAKAIEGKVSGMQPSTGKGTLIDLCRVLAELYESTADGHRVASDAGLRTIAIDFSGKATIIWGNILDEAEKQGMVQDVLRIARQEYPRNPHLGRFSHL